MAVVFDLDGTITSNDTYLLFLLSYLKSHPAKLVKCWLLPFAIIVFKLGLRDNTWLKTIFLRAIVGGTPREQLDSFVTEFLNVVITKMLRKKAIQELESHKANGHRLILATASFDFYVNALGKKLGFDTIICTEAVWDDNNRLLGEISGNSCYGIFKLEKIITHFQNNNKTSRIIAYTDHHSDLPLMEWADEAIVVNPTAKLKPVAEKKGYKIKIW